MRDQDLLRLVQAAKDDPRVVERLEHHIVEAFVHLGWTQQAAMSYLHLSLLKSLIPGVEDLAEWEDALQGGMPVPATKNLPECMSARADRTYANVREHILPGSVLDPGGGSGEIALRASRDGHHPTVLADVIDWRRNQGIGFVPVKHDRVKAQDASFDTVMALHVFHHSEDPEALLAEAFRVARRRVIFIESVTNDMEEYLYGCWVDWFYNRILHYSRDPGRKIPVPCRFLPATAWEQMVLRRFGLRPTVSRDLGIYQFLNPEHHWLFVYDKS